MIWFLAALLVLLASVQGDVGASNRTLEDRDKKVLSVFTVVKFPNTACDSSTSGRNGTCYTASECTSKGGSSSGACASSFGVCCVFEGSCGTTIAENNTYFSSSSRTLGDACTYTVCKIDSSICQIRLDFETFVLNDPMTLTTGLHAAGATGATNTMGNCLTDTFGVTSPGNAAIPVICGTNTGYHMYVPASDQCNQLSAAFGSASTATTSAFSIKVSQIECSSSRLAPSGCLQYFTSETGEIESFNYQSGGSVHLANQDYSACVRQGRTMCGICYWSPTTQAFGIGNANGIAAIDGVGSNCGSSGLEGAIDYILIPEGTCAPPVAISVSVDKYCLLELDCAATASTDNTIAPVNTVCTNMKPFKISFFTDGTEAGFPTSGEGSAVGNSEGFQLSYYQSSTCITRPA